MHLRIKLLYRIILQRKKALVIKHSNGRLLPVIRKEVKRGVCSLKENKLADVDNFRPELLNSDEEETTKVFTAVGQRV